MKKQSFSITSVIILIMLISFSSSPSYGGFFNDAKNRIKNTGKKIKNKVTNTGRNIKKRVEVTGGWDRYIYAWADREVPGTERWVAIRTPYKKHKRDMGNFWDIPGDGNQTVGPNKPINLWELPYKFQRRPQNDRRYKFHRLEEFTRKFQDKGFYVIECGTGYFVQKKGNRVFVNRTHHISQDHSFHFRIRNHGKNRFSIQSRSNNSYISIAGNASQNGSKLILVRNKDNKSYWEFIIISKGGEKKSTKQLIAKRAKETRNLAGRELNRLNRIMKQKGFNFKIGDTKVLTRKIKEITGFISRGLRTDPKWKRVKSNLPTTIKRDPDMPSFNWRDAGYMTSVKWQGGCGSCWAFGALGVYESIYKIRFNKTLDLSEQHIIDCLRTKRRDCGSCNGGAAISVFEALKYTSALPESVVPYQQKDLRCLSGYPKYNYKVKDSGWVSAGRNVRLIKELICKFGPVAGYVMVTDLFKAYKGGVYNEHPILPNLNKVNHVIVIVGWDDSKKAFLIKNSWGGWGEKGYMWIEYGSNNVGTGASWIKL